MLCRVNPLKNSVNRSYCRYNCKKYLSSLDVVKPGVNINRLNPANIQMLSPGLHKQIFRSDTNDIDLDTLEKVQKHLTHHNLNDKVPALLENIDFELPNLYGENIEEHFNHIVQEDFKVYNGIADSLASISYHIPEKPVWLMKPGWTKYFHDGRIEKVEEPDETGLVFDIEVCLNAKNIPVIAVALSRNAWYCWVSEYLIDEDKELPRFLTQKHLIPFDVNKECEERLLIGHNVSFDRSFIASQYELKQNKTRFLDTLSLHMCVSGVTNEQRNYLNSKNPILYDWMEVGTTNSLAALSEFYCGKKLDKSSRDLFVKGSLDEIRDYFQESVDYCAKDVLSTLQVFQTIWPMFQDHAKDPITYMGMLEMGTAYLPIDASWNDYVSRSEFMFNKVTKELKQALVTIAEDSLKLLKNKEYKKDPWLWALDWSLHKTVEKDMEDFLENNIKDMDVHEFIDLAVQELTEKRRNQLNLPGYPKWYRDLCKQTKGKSGKPNPVGISSQTKVTPSLLRLTWDGYPLHYEKDYGWGYLMPEEQSEVIPNIKERRREFPYEEFYNIIIARNKEEKEKKMKEGDINMMNEIYRNASKKNSIDIGISGIRFYKLPHKDGEGSNVGNPLAKDYLSKIEDGTLVSNGTYNAKQPIEFNKMIAFWRNGRKRIMSQNTIWFEKKPRSKSEYGVILPQIITAGTVTRRAVEPTWLTASNPISDRIGSELKSMVRPPHGYCLIGADVDSQELWIASLLGDAEFSGIHGSTALSWMTLQGKKGDGTDLHSRTADTIGMTRDEAKIFNYGRIYGAGERFAVRLLMQFNHQLTLEEAEEIARKLYKSTKGSRDLYQVTEYGKKVAKQLDIEIPEDGLVKDSLMKTFLQEGKIDWKNRYKVVEIRKRWHGGSESDMFNKLENIALSDKPRTPVLNCLITKALQPKYVQNYYKTSRVNWVVQSSAVDYLHLMLVSMSWLIKHYNIDARFCISIHDEVRYIVSEKDKYRAALALQITNLLTRSLFAYKLQMYDLPQSTAFFNAVDIDHVLRKEVDMDCKTPSNPYGLEKEYNIPSGESIDIYSLLEKTGGRLHK